MKVSIIGKVVRYELAPATPLTKFICFELDRDINFGELDCFTGNQVKIIIEEVKYGRQY